MLFEPAKTRVLRVPASDGQTLAVEITEGQGPSFLWLCGYAGDMNGTKAMHFKNQCEAWSFRLIRFDYRGVGQSSGDFASMTVSDYLADATAVLQQLTDSPVILIGSSMGGWLSLRLMQQFPAKIAAFIGIAAAPDFTIALAGQGDIHREHAVIYEKFIQDGNQNHVVLNQPLGFNGPIALLHGQHDDSVPWQTALKIADTLTTGDVTLHLIKDGDHRLSRESDLDLLWQVANNIRDKVVGPVARMAHDDDITI